jgi:hypothetical protein
MKTSDLKIYCIVIVCEISVQSDYGKCIKSALQDLQKHKEPSIRRVLKKDPEYFISTSLESPIVRIFFFCIHAPKV